jgi:exopolysaccharide biosynthesis polyprenyl glycosylphosphotransferase
VAAEEPAVASAEEASRATPAVTASQSAGAARDALRRRVLALSDLITVLGAAAVFSRFGSEGTAAGLWFAAMALTWIVLAKLYGLYDADHTRIRHTTLDEVPRLVNWVTSSVALTLLVIAIAPELSFSAAAAAAAWGTALGLAPLGRAGARGAWRRIVPPERGLLVGEGELANAFARKLALEPGHSFEIVRRIPLPAGAKGPELRAALDELRPAVEAERPERIVLAVEEASEELLAGVVAVCREARVKLSVAPPLRAMLGTAVNLSHLGELPVVEFRGWDPSRSTMAIKSLMDKVIAAVGLVVCSPLALAIAVAIRIDSRGRVIFRQTRAGKDARPFLMIKFRTMSADAEARLGEVVEPEKLAEPVFKLSDDPRVTRVGRLLRRTSLDELPQLLNVLRGEMSLVGPRPEELWLVERYSETERFRLSMRPGMTGPMQVHGRGDLDFQERLAIEREYIENYSLAKDLRILAGTFSVVLRRRGAY